MLEFIGFLTAKEQEILNLIYKSGFSVEENTPLCLLGKEFFGFLKKRQQTIVICTDNAMEIGGYKLPRNNDNDDFEPTGIYIRRALRHEAVHVAQMCKKGFLIDLTAKTKLKLHPYKQKAMRNSTRVSGNSRNEFEAYWMEDKPELIKTSLKKYCL